MSDDGAELPTGHRRAPRACVLPPLPCRGLGTKALDEVRGHWNAQRRPKETRPAPTIKAPVGLLKNHRLTATNAPPSPPSHDKAHCIVLLPKCGARPGRRGRVKVGPTGTPATSVSLAPIHVPNNSAYLPSRPPRQGTAGRLVLGRRSRISPRTARPTITRFKTRISTRRAPPVQRPSKASSGRTALAGAPRADHSVRVTALALA